MSEAPQLAALYRQVAESIDMKELIDRTSKTLLRSIDNELTEIKSALIAVDDIATKEYRDLHFRGRVLAELFAQIQAVVNTGAQARAQIQVAEEEARQDQPGVFDNDD